MFKIQTAKCPYCTGKHNNSRKTLYLYPGTSTYYCFRCSAFGSLNQLEGIEIRLENKVPQKTNFIDWNGRGERYSLVTKRDFTNNVDTFQIKEPNGKQVGIHQRKPPKKSRTIGTRAFGYHADYLALDSTVRLVEGPYDVVYPNDVCSFGIPNNYQSRLLKPYQLILCPDGDVWKSKKTVLQWLKPFLYSNVKYVERVPDDKDPDEITETERKIIEWKELKQYVKNNS